MSDDQFWLVALVFVGILALVVYLLPSIIASERRHRERTPIFVLNLLLGWTFVGWVAALVWALTSHVEPPGPSLEALQAANAALKAELAATESATADSEAAEASRIATWLRELEAEARALQLYLAALGEYLTVSELFARFNPGEVSPETIREARADLALRWPLTRAQWWANATGWAGFRLRRHEDAVVIRGWWRSLMVRVNDGPGVAPPLAAVQTESDDDFAPSIPLEEVFDDLDRESKQRGD